MCLAIQEMREEERLAGIDQVNRLNRLLVSNEKYDELERSTKDKEYQKQLFEKYGII